MVKKLGKFVKCDFCGREIWKENNQLRTRKNYFCSLNCKKDFQKQPMKYSICDDYATFIVIDKFQNKHICYIDAEDVKFLDHKFCITFGENNKTYWLQDFHGNKLHRLIMSSPKNLCIDHINHNTLDNRKSNLRICTKGENNQNKKSCYPNSATKIRNVYFKKENNKYFVKITVKGKNYFRGYFPNTTEGLNKAIKTAIELRNKIMPFAT